MRLCLVKNHENECPRLNDQICTCKHIPGCGVETHKTPEIQTDLTLHPVQGPQQFRTLLVSNDTMIKQCDTCNTNTEHKTTTRREFPPTMHYLVVSIKFQNRSYGKNEYMKDLDKRINAHQTTERGTLSKAFSRSTNAK